MFDELRRAWREAVENFRRELHAEDDARDPDLGRDIASARSDIRRLEAELRETRARLAAEREAEQTCVRRERLALQIGDMATASIAADFAARHRERAALLERKEAVLAAEHALRARELFELEELASRRRLDPDGSIGWSGATLGDGVDPGPFDRLEKDARERAAAARLEELKRRMQG